MDGRDFYSWRAGFSGCSCCGQDVSDLLPDNQLLETLCRRQRLSKKQSVDLKQGVHKYGCAAILKKTERHTPVVGGRLVRSAFGSAVKCLKKAKNGISLSTSHHIMMSRMVEMLRLHFLKLTYSALKQEQQEIQGAVSAV